MMDLDALSLEDLKKLKKDVDKAITGYEARKRKEALAAVEAKAAEMGFSLADLASSSKKTQAPKFKNPDDESQTWSGRGRQPEWYKAALAAGKSVEDMAI